jgi:signal transduction histidine kinase
MKNISLTEKLILYILFLGISAIVIVSVFSFYSTKLALMDRTFDQLTSLRIMKKQQVELFFSDRIRDVVLLSNSDDTKNIMDRITAENKNSSGTNNTEDHNLYPLFSLYLNQYQSLKNYFSGIYLAPDDNRFIYGRFEDLSIKAPHPSSELLSIIKKVRKNEFAVQDIVPSGNNVSQSLYMGALVMNKSKKGKGITGVIILELSMDAINAIMLNNNPESGLGNTGETYLVGEDYMMRSNSRFLPETIMHKSVRTQSALNAYHGREGTIITPDYRNIEVLSSYGQLAIPGINWIILAEIDLSEAMIPIFKMRNSILFLGIFLSLVFFGIVFLIARRITRPILQLKEAVIKVGKGEYDVKLPIGRTDEIGELTQAFNAMTIQIREKTRELQHERMGRIRSVIDGEESERQRLSRELHDGIGQSMIALTLRLESLLYSDEGQIKENIKILKDQFDETIDEIRRISNNLMPSVLEVFGISIALRNLCQETGDHTGMKITFLCQGNFDGIHTKLTTYIYRITQEALNNIVKHSCANEVRINLSRTADVINLTVSDNGKGFIPEEAAMESGNGLYNMRERVGLLRGTFNIYTAINKGTKIIVNLPLF